MLGQATATGLSAMVSGDMSHDCQRRFKIDTLLQQTPI
jgi:hypothetical protein